MTMKPLKGDLISTFADQLNLPIRTVRQTVDALKARDRIGSGRPISPPITARDLARIILALTSPTLRGCVDHEMRLGAISLFTGDGQPTVETQLSDMIEEAVGMRYGASNFRDGQIVFGDNAVLFGTSNYKLRGSESLAYTRFIAVHSRAIAAIARILMPEN